MSAAWIYQKVDQVRSMGEEAAPYYVGWYEPDGRRKGKCIGPGKRGKRDAEKFRSKLESDLRTGDYKNDSRKLWSEFRKEYTDRVLAGLAKATGLQAEISLDHYERLMKPIRVFAINTGLIDEFIKKRRTEAGRRQGDTVSPYTVNKDLRHIKAALAVAVEWGYLKELPKFRMEKAPGKLPRYIPAEQFANIYRSCEVVARPEDIPNVKPADWWRALLALAYMTGWRIGDILGLRRDQVDLETGMAVSLAESNKGKRDELVKLHPIVVDHLRAVVSFNELVFPWDHDPRTLYTDWARIQEAAGIKLPCPKQHKHTRFCYVYGFHDLRRAFATMNADRLTADALQALMRHKSYATTQKYINMTRQLDQAVASLHVPEVLKTAATR